MSSSLKPEYKRHVKHEIDKREDKKYKINREKYNREVVEPSDGPSGSPPPLEKEKPNFEPSGLLAAETNSKNGILLKYCVPNESTKPDLNWRLYIFKPSTDDGGDNLIKTVNIDTKEFYLLGKDVRIADIPLQHPSISKQHAVIQFRNVDDQAVPYLIDLESTNGTFLNDVKLESSKYYELREKDIIKFGYSSREYVLLNTKSL